MKIWDLFAHYSFEIACINSKWKSDDTFRLFRTEKTPSSNFKIFPQGNVRPTQWSGSLA
jgi:hypothetical protein